MNQCEKMIVEIVDSSKIRSRICIHYYLEEYVVPIEVKLPCHRITIESFDRVTEVHINNDRVVAAPVPFLLS